MEFEIVISKKNQKEYRPKYLFYKFIRNLTKFQNNLSKNCHVMFDYFISKSLFAKYSYSYKKQVQYNTKSTEKQIIIW